MSLHELRRDEAALESFRRALAASETLGKADDIRVARWTVAWALRWLRRNEEALAILRRLEAEFAAIGRLLQRNTGPIFHLIEDMFGQPIVEVQQEISAGTVPPRLAAGLKAKSGAMALLVQRTYRLASGRIAQVAVNTHPASRFRHAMTMRRVKG